jgi:hypothetical protein
MRAVHVHPVPYGAHAAAVKVGRRYRLVVVGGAAARGNIRSSTYLGSCDRSFVDTAFERLEMSVCVMIAVSGIVIGAFLGEIAGKITDWLIEKIRKGRK